MCHFNYFVLHIYIYIYVAQSTPLRKDTGVFKSFGRFIGLKCHNYVLYLCFICMYKDDLSCTTQSFFGNAHNMQCFVWCNQLNNCQSDQCYVIARNELAPVVCNDTTLIQ